MGFYFRRSKSLGPFRLNFSKGGIGVSFGARGARVGVGPRGKYVHVGRYGLYYRQTISNNPRLGGDGAKPISAPAAEQLIESGDVSAMADEASAVLLEAISHARARVPLFPFALALTALASLALGAAGAPAAAWGGVLIVGVSLSAWARVTDGRARAVELQYTLSGPDERAYEALVAAGKRLVLSGRVRLIEATADTSDWKRQAGAARLLRTRTVSPALGLPRGIHSSLRAVILPCGVQELCFLPDRLLVFHGDRVGSVEYQHIVAGVEEKRFIEYDGVPQDAQVVGSSWQYVNKDGGPNRRFASNREIPIALYGELSLTSDSGLNERLQVSNTSAAHTFAEAIAGMVAIHRHPETPGSDKSDEAQSVNDSDVERIVRERPRGWEYLLFAAALARFLKSARIASGEPIAAEPLINSDLDDQAALHGIEVALNAASEYPSAITEALNVDLPKAVGPPGHPGDAAAILAVAHKMAENYELLRIASAKLSATSVTKQLALEVRRSIDGLCWQVEEFAERLATEVPGHLQAGAPLDLSLTLSVVNEAALAEAIRKMPR